MTEEERAIEIIREAFIMWNAESASSMAEKVIQELKAAGLTIVKIGANH